MLNLFNISHAVIKINFYFSVSFSLFSFLTLIVWRRPSLQTCPRIHEAIIVSINAKP